MIVLHAHSIQIQPEPLARSPFENRGVKAKGQGAARENRSNSPTRKSRRDHHPLDL